jgi:hypothetical protein
MRVNWQKKKKKREGRKGPSMVVHSSYSGGGYRRIMV